MKPLIGFLGNLQKSRLWVFKVDPKPSESRFRIGVLEDSESGS